MADAHFGEQLRKIAHQRGIDPAKVTQISCRGCGMTIFDPPTAFAFGFAHWPECWASDSKIDFKVRSTEAITSSKAQPTRPSFWRRLKGDY